MVSVPKRIRPDVWLFAVLLLVLVVLVLYPLWQVVYLALTDSGLFSLAVIRRTWSDPSNQLALKRSLHVSVSAAAIATVLGSVLAWIATRTDMPYSRLMRSLLMAPFLIPPFIGAIAWLQLLGPVGYLNKLLMWMLGRSEPLFSIYGAPGIILVMALHNYPIVYLTVSTALEGMDSTLEESALMSGASRWRVLWDITLPVVAPATTGAAFLVFSANMANFGVPSLLGRSRGYLVLTTKIYQAIQSFGLENNFEIASALALQLLIVSTLALLVQKVYLGRKRYTVLSGKGSHPQVMRMGPFRWLLLGFCGAVFFVTSVAPMAAVLLTSLIRAIGVAPVPSNWTLANYVYVLVQSPNTVRAMRNSVALGLLAATIATAIGGTIAYFTVRSRIRGRQVADFLGSMPHAVPGTVLGLALILAWIKPAFGPSLYNTPWIILLAYVAHYLTMSIRTISASLSQVHESLDEAARMSGATASEATRHIILPLIRPGLVASWFLVLMPCLRELTLSTLLWSVGNETIGVAVYNMSEGGQAPYAAAMGIVLILVVLFGNLATRRVTKGKYGF